MNKKRFSSRERRGFIYLFIIVAAIILTGMWISHRQVREFQNEPMYTPVSSHLSDTIYPASPQNGHGKQKKKRRKKTAKSQKKKNGNISPTKPANSPFSPIPTTN